MARTPKDELKLAAMIAAAKARGLKGSVGTIYEDGAVCAIGGKLLARGLTLGQLKKKSEDYSYGSKNDYDLYSGNDTPVGGGEIYEGGSDFDIGSAFQQAMKP